MLRALPVVMILAAAAVAEEKKFKVSETEQGVIDATNAERKALKLPALKMHEKLMAAARDHAANMAKQGKAEHELDGVNVDKRADKAGYKYSRLGENVAWNQKTPKDVLAAWMDSKPHRENILNKEYTEIGVAAVDNGNGEIYWCQVFGKPRR